MGNRRAANAGEGQMGPAAFNQVADSMDFAALVRHPVPSVAEGPAAH